MKKFFISLAATIFMTVAANAQVYVGGTVGFSTSGGENSDDETSFSILPEIGYNINDKFAVGAIIGYEKGSASLLNIDSNSSVEVFEFSPYARYTFMRSKYVNLFVDMGVDIVSGSIEYPDLYYQNEYDITAYSIGVKPGIAVNLNEHFSLVGKIGYLGYTELNPEGDNNNYHSFGLNLNGNNITFGVYYTF